jgi:rubrerythrin
MNNEQIKTIDALKIAIQMEIDGKNFYTKASKESSNEPGKNLLARLAEEEDIHRKLFEKIYSSISENKGWIQVDYKYDRGWGLRTVFDEALKNAGTELRNLSSELDVISTARMMETRTYDFYTDRANKAIEPAEKQYYEQLAIQEQGHNLVLTDYFEYLQNPAGWFVKKEHPTLD